MDSLKSPKQEVVENREGTWRWADLKKDQMDWSPSCWEMLGYAPNEFPSRYSEWLRLIHPEDRHWVVQTSAPHQNKCFVALHRDFEYRMLHKSGEYRWFQHHTIIDHDGSGKPFRMQGSARAINDRKRSEGAQSSSELGRFASICSHDLQEPLRKVRAFGDLLKEECSDALGEQGRDYIERMQNAIVRMQTLIDDLLCFSRVDQHVSALREVDLGSVAREVVSDLELKIAETDGRVQIGQLPRLAADRTQMRQLLQNLIGNSLKFHRNGVPPVVEIQGRVSQPSRGEQEKCEITVEDNGIGFDEKYSDRIFFPFQRLHSRDDYPGTGIGLAVCRRIVDWHRGTIAVDSVPGKGTTFRIALPRQHAEVTA